ncbi:hypothetical protein HYU91_01335 [Candidatus Collierbacteria bacterium]|nr:hypothetical protein [Candidatus Collierbacteria bacterium]
MFTKIVQLVLIFSLLFLSSVGFSNQLYATDLDYDFDSDSELAGWTVSSHGGRVITDNGVLTLEAINNVGFPYIFPNNFTLPDDDYYIEFKYQFAGDTKYGYGIGLSDNLPVDYRSNPLSDSDYIFVVWPGQFPTYGIGSAVCPIDDISCQSDKYYAAAYYGTFDTWNTARLEYSNKSYKLFIDNLLVFESEQSTKKITNIWVGEFQTVNNLPWGRLKIDYIKSGPLSTSETNPIVVIPGVGGSWDFGAILKGETGTDWKVPSFIDLYDNLTNSLVNAGYEKDKNLFVFGYDWRKGLNDLSVDLDNYVNGLVSQGKIGATDKIDFIGHSYGGLVARAYGQKIGTDKIDKIITAGSPHQGLIDSYGLWEGATVWKNVWWQRAALELMIKLNQKAGENRVAVVRRLAPGTKDILPTFDFLKKNDILLSSGSILQKNLTLNDLNNDTATIAGVLWANGGNSNQTDRFLKVVDRGWLEKTQGQWEDGKPTGSAFETTNDGDGAVLSLSAVASFTNQSLIGTNHEEIVGNKTGIEKIFDELGLDKSKVVTDVTPDSRKSVFIASLRSPGTLHVCDETDVCDGSLGIYLADEKLFFLPGYSDHALTTTVEANGETGKYQLFVGDMDEDQTNWTEERGNLISPNQVDTYPDDAQTSDRSFDEDLSILNGLIPNWDKKNLMAVARSEAQPKSKRIVAIRQLRELLSGLAIKAYKNNKTDQIEAIIDVWKDIDDLAETVIGSDNSTKTVFLNANILQVEAYKTLADNLLKNSSSYYAGTFYALFTDRFAEAKELKTSKRDISLDKTLSSRYLLLTALGVR